MEYVKKNLCDNSKVYKFENFKSQTESASNTRKGNGSSSGNGRSKSRNLRSSSRNNNSGENKDSSGNNEESSGLSMKNNEEDKESNKRILKMNKKNLNMFNDYEKFKEVQRQARKNKSKGGHERVFNVNKVNNKQKENSQESPNYTSSEEQKNSSNISGGFKTQNGASNTDSNTTKPPTSYITLSNGSVIIKGNEIETTVPCDIETINNKVSMISPHYPVKVTMYPLSLNQPHVYDPKSQSFTSKGSYQSFGPMNSGENQSNSQNLNNVSGLLNSNTTGTIESTPFEIYMKMLEQNYCLGTCSTTKRLSSSTPSNGYISQEQPMHRSASQAPLNYPHIMGNSNSGSSNRNSCE